MSYQITPQRQAMLDTINWCEGKPNYNELFGYVEFNNNGPHPNVCQKYSNTCTTAAGRYQFLYGTWQDSIQTLGIPDFMSASNQDQAALQRIEYRDALSDIDYGHIESAISKLSWEWASMPPGRYGQPVKSLEEVLEYYDTRLSEIIEKKTESLSMILLVLGLLIVLAMVWAAPKIFKLLK